MSLKNQFLIGSLIVLLLVFAMLFAGTGVRLQHYFQSQLSGHAQDTATSLAVAVNTALRQHDRILLETTVQAVFDSGYYKRIAVIGITGEKLIEKVQPPTNGDVPPWLPQMIKLDTPLRSAFITAGWKQAGKIEVTSQPAFAYLELWKLMQDASLWLAIAIILTMLLMAALVRTILKPLANIEKAALAVSSKQFSLISPLPSTRDLRRVVVAFNTLSSSVKMMLAEAENLAEKYRRQTLTDTLTGIGNRRGLNANIEMLLESPQGEYALALFRVNGLADLNKSAGHDQGNRLVQSLAGALSQSPQFDFLCRLQGTDFAALLEFSSEGVLEAFLDSTSLLLEKICRDYGVTGSGICTAVAVRLLPDDTASSALTRADEGLARASQIGSSVVDDAPEPGMPSGLWKQYLIDAIAANRFRLLSQPVIRYAGDSGSGVGEILHEEIYSRLIVPDKQPIMAARFMPMARRHNLAAKLDRHCLHLLLLHMKKTHATGRKFAFNISDELFADPAFPVWFSHELAKSSIAKSDLILEISESVLRASPQNAKIFSAALIDQGLTFGVDQFGLHKGTVTQLAGLRPAYFKLATYLSQHCVEEAEYGEYIAWLVKTSGMLGIPVIATCVEKPEWQQCLLAAGVTSYQGQMIGAETRLENPD